MFDNRTEVHLNIARHDAGATLSVIVRNREDALLRARQMLRLVTAESISILDADGTAYSLPEFEARMGCKPLRAQLR